MDYTNFELLPLADWGAFERLCLRLWMRIWDDPHAMLHGPAGQAQQGVDIYGTPRGAPCLSGVQCKSKDRLIGGKLTEAEIRTEVENAKAFKPPLGELIIATSAEADRDLQEVARLLTQEHQSQGLFSVHVYGWRDIQTRLAEYPDLIHLIYGEPTIAGPVSLDEPTHARLGDQLLKLGDSIVQRMAQLSVRGLDGADGPAHAQLDLVRDLIRGHSPRQAITLLEGIREREWPSPENSRVLKNKSPCRGKKALLQGFPPLERLLRERRYHTTKCLVS